MRKFSTKFLVFSIGGPDLYVYKLLSKFLILRIGGSDLYVSNGLLYNSL